MQNHIRTVALERAIAARQSRYRLLLFEDDEELIAVGSHQPESLVLDTGYSINAARLVVLGVAQAHQGKALKDGTRIADKALRLLIQEAVTYRRARVVSGIVARDNIRSLTMCERNGLASQTTFGTRYVRVTGRFEVSSAPRRRQPR